MYRNKLDLLGTRVASRSANRIMHIAIMYTPTVLNASLRYAVTIIPSGFTESALSSANGLAVSPLDAAVQPFIPRVQIVQSTAPVAHLPRNVGHRSSQRLVSANHRARAPPHISLIHD